MSTNISGTGISAVAASHTRPATTAVQGKSLPNSKPDPAALKTSSETAAISSNHQKDLDDLVQRLNEHFKQTGRNLNFSVDEKSDRTVITVKDSSTGEVIRQIPDLALLKVGHDLEKIKGMLLNKEI